MNRSRVFQRIFTGPGALTLTWETAVRCDCYSTDTRQPDWSHDDCQGTGAIYTTQGEVRGLFRSQDRWETRRSSGERDLADAQLTLPVDVKPSYTDERVRDRFTVVAATRDVEQGTVFFPQAEPVPFLIGDVQHAWRVKVQGANTDAQPRLR